MPREPPAPPRCNTVVVDEFEIIQRARAGDPTAFGVLAERYQPDAFHLACVILGDQTEAQDVTQDALLKAYLAFDRFEDSAPFRPWLLQIVANEARNRRRSVGRRAHLAAQVAAISDAHASAPSAEVTALADEQRRTLLAEVAALRDQDRLVIASRYFLDLSEREIADLLGCARGTVKSRLSRGLGRLRQRVTPLLLLLLLTLLAAGVLAWPEARDAIADRLGLRGVSITHVPEAPTPVTVPTSLGLGEPVTREVAEARLSHRIVLPGALGAPVAYYAQLGEAWLVYDLRGTLLLTEFARTDFEPAFVAKGLPPRTSIEELVVAGGRGLWIGGAPHVFFHNGNSAPPRLAGNTLLWVRDGLTLRIESALDRDSTLKIAESVNGTD